MPALLWPASSPSLGETFTLQWRTPGSGPAWLFVSATLAAPLETRFGTWFLGSAADVASYAVPPFGSRSVTVPLDAALVGRALGFQVFEPSVGLTRPVVAVARP